MVLNWYKELTWINTTQRNTCFPQTPISLTDLIIIAPKAAKKRPVIAFVHNNSNVYRKEKNIYVWWHVEMKEMMKLAPFHFRWYPLASCDWNKGCNRNWKEDRLELKLYIFDQFCAWLTEIRKILLQNLKVFVTGILQVFPAPLKGMGLMTARRIWLMWTYT